MENLKYLKIKIPQDLTEMLGQHARANDCRIQKEIINRLKESFIKEECLNGLSKLQHWLNSRKN